MFFKIVQNVTKYLDYFCGIFFTKSFQKSPSLITLVVTQQSKVYHWSMRKTFLE